MGKAKCKNVFTLVGGKFITGRYLPIVNSNLKKSFEICVLGGWAGGSQALGLEFERSAECVVACSWKPSARGGNGTGPQRSLGFTPQLTLTKW